MFLLPVISRVWQDETARPNSSPSQQDGVGLAGPVRRWLRLSCTLLLSAVLLVLSAAQEGRLYDQ